jgi:hypothetical protein
LGQQNTIEDVKSAMGLYWRQVPKVLSTPFFSCLHMARSIFLRRRWMIMPNINFVSCCYACLKIVCLIVHALGVKIDTKSHNMPIISQLICVLVFIMCQSIICVLCFLVSITQPKCAYRRPKIFQQFWKANLILALLTPWHG